MPGDQSATHSEGDRELGAIGAVVAALRPLKEDERRSVLEYVLRRFGAVPLQLQPAMQSAPLGPSVAPSTPYSESGAIHDIRTLRQEKAPKSANEMAALVAYYVSELAPPSERKPEINKTDIERYFKSAGFKLTAHAGPTLVNAKNAGYLDGGSDSGYYKLNPVGYNLVVHRLSSTGGRRRERQRSSKNKKASLRKKQ